MMEATTVAYVACAIAGISLAYNIIEKAFGGGNALAGKFATTKAETAAEIKSLRDEMHTVMDHANSNTKIGIDAISANIHQMQVGFAEFRATMAENYMRRDAYYKAADELKRDMKESTIETRNNLKELADSMNDRFNRVEQIVEANRKEANARA